jgi:general stress protein YciG
MERGSRPSLAASLPPSPGGAKKHLTHKVKRMITEQNRRGGGMSVREAGQKGGETVKNKYGAQFYEEIGRKGGLATKLAHGHEFYEQIGKKGGKKGGEATRDRYGPNFYERIGQKGGQKVKQLIEEGKRAANDRKQKAS